MTNRNKTFMASQAWPVAANASQPFSADGCKGIRFYVDVTVPNGGAVVVKLQTQDVVARQWHDMTGVTTASISTATRTVLTVYPGIVAAANKEIANVLTGPFRFVATVTTAAVTFTVSGDLIL